MCVQQKGPSGGGEKQTLEVWVMMQCRSGGGFLGAVWTERLGRISLYHEEGA